MLYSVILYEILLLVSINVKVYTNFIPINIQIILGDIWNAIFIQNRRDFYFSFTSRTFWTSLSIQMIIRTLIESSMNWTFYFYLLIRPNIFSPIIGIIIIMNAASFSNKTLPCPYSYLLDYIQDSRYHLIWCLAAIQQIP